MKYSRNPKSGIMEEYTDDGVYVGNVVTMGDVLSSGMIAKDGGPGSGNFGHAGRPGKVGGSAPDDGMSGPSEENREFSGMQVRIAQSIAKKAMKHPKVYDDWASELTADEAQALEGQFWKTHEPDENGEYIENLSEYYERIWRMLAANAPEEHHENKPASGNDIADSYDWNGASYTEPKFGQVIDTQIEDIINRQGFNGVPRVVSKDEMDKFLEDHPESPIMFRTFTAPNRETLDQYNKDLESGAWYVDCGVGGSKYGQGMYTAAAYPLNVDDLVSIYNEHEVYRLEKGFVCKGHHDEKTEVYQISGYEYSLDRLEEGKTYAIVSDSVGDRDITVVTVENGKLIDRLLNRERHPSGQLSIYNVNILPEEELSKRDTSRPLGQMLEYARINEEREGKVFNTYRATQSGMARKAGEPLGAVFSQMIIPDGTPGGMWSGDRHAFEPDKEKGIRLEDAIGNLKDGFYILDVEEEYKKGEPYPCAEVYQIVDGVAKSPDHRDDFLKTYLNNPDVYHNPIIYPAKLLPDPEPATATRRMTLDPSANMVTYEKLTNMYDQYKREFREKLNEGNLHYSVMNEMADAHNLTEDQLSALGSAIRVGQIYTWPHDIFDDPSWQLAAARLGGNEKTYELFQEYNNRRFAKESSRIDDIGAYAAAKGYDAVVCSNYGRTIVVLNRTKLILSDERVEVPGEEAS